MLARVSKLILVVLLSCTLGLHWALLQSAAWVGMVVTFSQTAPFTEALAKTFDGKHPCNLCNFVRAGQRSEQQREALKPIVPIDGLVVQSRVLLFPPATEPSDFASVHLVVARAQSPPVPPPLFLQS